MKRKAFWVAIYAIIAALKFLLDKAQRLVEDRIFEKPKKEDPK